MKIIDDYKVEFVDCYCEYKGDCIEVYNNFCEYLGSICGTDPAYDWEQIKAGHNPIEEEWEDGAGNTCTLDMWDPYAMQHQSEEHIYARLREIVDTEHEDWIGEYAYNVMAGKYKSWNEVKEDYEDNIKDEEFYLG